jgi:thiol-disulfide isomerase/thioredoxin
METVGGPSEHKIKGKMRIAMPSTGEEERDMRWLHRMAWLGVLATAWWQTTAAAQGQAGPDVNLKVVKYDELAEMIRASKGKVVMVDFWALTCIPCKKNFPHIVQMHKTYASKGLVIISVATDELDGDTGDPRPKILKFLQSKDAIFTNVLLDEPNKVLVDKLRVGSLPCLYVFDRDGKWRHFIGDKLVDDKGEVRHAEIEALVKSLLD